MSSRWCAVVVEASDPARLADWWADVLAYRVLHRYPDEVAIGADGESLPALLFVPAPAGRTDHHRLHLDLCPDDQRAEVERLVDMGARRVETGHGATRPRVVLADPEGNEFCVLGA